MALKVRGVFWLRNAQKKIGSPKGEWPVTCSDVVSGLFEVQGRARSSDVRACLLTVAGHWLHLLSLEAFEKGEDMETSQDCFESLPGPFVRSQKS